MNKKTKLFVGPVSKNIVDVIIEQANIIDSPIGLIPSRRQIDFDNGYVNNWRTKDFVSYVREKTDNVIIVRDHAGPDQGTFKDNGIDSINNDVDECFDIIHLDPWKKFQNSNEALQETINLIETICKKSNDVCFEVGTEEAIKKYTSKEFEEFLNKLKISTKEKFKRIKYAVIQSGTRLELNKNIGKFNKNKSIEYINICKKFNILSKEHNGDYLTASEIKERFKLGLDAINLAPEFGFIETKCILDDIRKRSDKYTYERLFEICYESKKWEKWIPKKMISNLLLNNKNVFIEVCAHYEFSNPEILKLKEENPSLNDKIKKNLKKRIKEILCAIK